MAKANKGSSVASATPEETGNVTVGGNRRNVEVMQVLDEIHSQPDEPKVTDEFDHRSDEEKEAEGYAEIIAKWKGEKIEDGQESDKGEDNTADDGEPDDNTQSKGDTKDEATQEEEGDELPVIPEVLRNKALNLGVKAEEIEKIKNIDDLTKIVSILEELPKQEETEETKPEVDPLEELKLDPDEYEEELVEKFDKLVQIVKDTREKNEKLLEKEQARDAEIQRQQHVALLNQFDMTVDSIENEELFGSFKDSKIDDDSHENRKKLFNEAVKVAKLYPEYTMEQLVEEAGKKAFGNVFNKKKAKEAEISKKLEERSQNILGKPSQREAMDDIEDTSTKEGRVKAAARAVGEKLKEFGLKK